LFVPDESEEEDRRSTSRAFRHGKKLCAVSLTTTARHYADANQDAIATSESYILRQLPA